MEGWGGGEAATVACRNRSDKKTQGQTASWEDNAVKEKLNGVTRNGVTRNVMIFH